MHRAPPEEAGNTRLSLLLAAAMFVLVVDTSLMNVSISRSSGPGHHGQRRPGAIALEALVSAAFILISSKLGDLFGRSGPTSWACWLRDRGPGDDPGPEPDGDHRVLGHHRRAGRVAPAPRHAVARPRELRGGRQKKAYALVGAAAAIAAAVGPLLGGFVTTYLRGASGSCWRPWSSRSSWPDRGGQGRSVHGDRQVDLVGAGLSVVGMGGVVLGILAWQEGGDFVRCSSRWAP